MNQRRQTLKNYLAAAISDAKCHSTGINLVAPHSYMKLARILIDSTQSSRTDSIHDKDSMRSIVEAEDVLEEC